MHTLCLTAREDTNAKNAALAMPDWHGEGAKIFVANDGVSQLVCSAKVIE